MSESQSFCILPWVSMAIRNNGNYRVCCNANTSKNRGLLKNTDDRVMNASTTTLAEARNSKTIKEIRQQMLNGQWPESCQRCLKEEQSGIRSKRLFSRDLFSDEYTQAWAAGITDTEGTLKIEKSPLLDLDIRFGNKCNLACRMCGPSDSSLWEIDFQKLGGKLSGEKFDWYSNESFWKDLESDSKHLQHIYIVGGEPLLIDRHYEFLQFLVDSKYSSKVVLEYNTNLTVLPDKVLSLWSNFHEVRVGVSFDGVGPVNDYIRYPSQFSIMEKNLEKIDRASGNIKAWLACTISIYNFHHLVDIMKWVESKKFRRIGKSEGKRFFVPHPVHKPEHLSIQSLPLDLKQTYAKHLRQTLQKYLGEGSLDELAQKKATSIVEKYIHFMESKDHSEQWSHFQDYTLRLDQIRQQNVFSLEPLFKF